MRRQTDHLKRPTVFEQPRLADWLECRACGVICERVVYPWHCLKQRRTCVYAYREGAKLYFGCVHKVFLPELEVDAVEPSDSPTGSRSDPYGPLRVLNSPRAECPVAVERAYPAGEGLSGCVNPLFVREALRVQQRDDLGARGDEGQGTDSPLLG